MAANALIAIYERAGYRFAVFQEHIDVVWPGNLFKTHEQIPLCQLATVEVRPIGGELVLRMTDARTKHYLLGAHASGLQQAILSVLPAAQERTVSAGAS